MRQQGGDQREHTAKNQRSWRWRTCVHRRIWNQKGSCSSALTAHMSPAAQISATDVCRSLQCNLPFRDLEDLLQPLVRCWSDKCYGPGNLRSRRYVPQLNLMQSAISQLDERLRDLRLLDCAQSAMYLFTSRLPSLFLSRFDGSHEVSGKTPVALTTMSQP